MTDAAEREVLVVEDDQSIGSAVRSALEVHGYRARWCTSAASALEAVAHHVPDLVLLDVGLPDSDGFSLCRRLRTDHPSVPIVLVTARDAEIDIVVGLDAGAGDYVTKPFSMNVLLARIRSQLRSADVAESTAAIEIGVLRIDAAAYTVSVAGVAVDLRPREFELLVALARDAGKVVTRERLLAEVWDVHWESSTKTLEMHVLALRRKLGDAIDVATVRGVGYRMNLP